MKRTDKKLKKKDCCWHLCVSESSLCIHKPNCVTASVAFICRSLLTMVLLLFFIYFFFIFFFFIYLRSFLLDSRGHWLMNKNNIHIQKYSTFVLLWLFYSVFWYIFFFRCSFFPCYSQRTALWLQCAIMLLLVFFFFSYVLYNFEYIIGLARSFSR